MNFLGVILIIWLIWLACKAIKYIFNNNDINRF